MALLDVPGLPLLRADEHVVGIADAGPVTAAPPGSVTARSAAVIGPPNGTGDTPPASDPT